jgi:hypothetical protein
VLTLEVIDKTIRRDPAIRLERHRQLLLEMQEEIRRLQLEIRRLEIIIDQRRRKREGEIRPSDRTAQPSTPPNSRIINLQTPRRTPTPPSAPTDTQNA